MAKDFVKTVLKLLTTQRGSHCQNCMTSFVDDPYKNQINSHTGGHNFQQI
jgi:hypothetical protein